MLAEAQPKANRRLNVPVWCKFWCKSLAHVIYLGITFPHRGRRLLFHKSSSTSAISVSYFSGVAVGIGYSFYWFISLYFLKLSKHIISCCRDLGEREMLDCQIYFTVQLR